MAKAGTLFIILFILLYITIGSGQKCIRQEQIITDESGRLLSWTGQECCSWQGITCSNKTGHVLKINLHNPMPFDYDKFYNSFDSDYAANYSKSCLSGEISPALLDLKQLQYLDLSMNNFSMIEIPEFFGSFKNLRYLNLSVARFQGNIPSQIGKLSSLEFLDMSDFWTNSLSADSLHWLSRLSSLKHVDLSGVHLGQAKDCNLVELRLDGNGFGGSVPQNMARLSSLTVLGLSSNFFNSSVPESLFNLRNLTYLDLSQNRFQGTIPKAIVNLCSLRFLDLSDSGFTGEIPAFGGCHQDLDTLRLSYNSFHGPIPESFGIFSSLRELDISNNVLTGSIPSSSGQLSNLETLDVSNNSLSGVVSESHFAKLTKLTDLSMFLNDLVFNFSSQWIPPFQLQSIKLTSCTLGPKSPTWLQTQRDVEELRISGTGISDRLPDWFSKLYSSVHYLDISKNNISGELPQFEEAINRPYRRLIMHSNSFHGPFRPIPSDVLLFDISNNSVSGNLNIPVQNGKILTLEVLIVSNNQLNGSIPSILCKIKTMTILDLANNQFSGEVPGCIGQMETLAMLDLTNNTLHGEIPSSFSSLTLSSLHLENNKFQGRLPSMENMTYLRILNVGKNSFTGVIPPWIGQMQNLAFLNLQSNEFHGEVPQFLCQLQELQLINLAGNNITGQIPSCIGNLTAMKTEHSSLEYLIMDVDYGGSISQIVNGIERRFTKTMPFLTSLELSDNNISGEIPENMTDLVGLRNLNLSGNNLTEQIPENIGEMRELISLDLSRNQLSGQIPTSLSSLTYLNNLNLSYNNLSGRIPSGNQLRLFDPSIYRGNIGLCGDPLPRRCDSDAAAAPPSNENDDRRTEDGGSDDSLFPWFYAGIGPGFLVGFLGVCGVFHFAKSWRYAVFQYIEARVR
ncbi:Leucine-rich repeat protein [Handroanthus impetiginosus]|uniref:Leucine-rich repeat protein n=1 Tax=Handroanthus impetiginosus TaxID=429701 RepID=A0A2G9GHL8_9LAMI|nr:Leucine-rich repeat protein [Handroanthus impetiginosus]